MSYLDKLEEVGGNHIRVWASSWFGQIEHETQLTTWRLDQAWLLDQVLAASKERGIYVTLVFDNHHDFTEGKAFPYGINKILRSMFFFNEDLPEAYQERLRYMISRYGAFDNVLSWELFNEIDLTGVDRLRLVNWARSASQFLRQIDPYKRLRTISWAGEDWPEMREIEAINLFQIHRYLPPLDDMSGNDHDLLATMVADTIPLLDDEHPFIFAEVGHQGPDEDNTPGNKIDQSGLILAHKAWTGFLLGGAGMGMNWWWDTWIDKNNLWSIYEPMGTITKKIDWTDPALKPIEVPLNGDLRVIGWQSPRQALIWPQGLSDNWHQQLISKAPIPYWENAWSSPFHPWHQNSNSSSKLKTCSQVTPPKPEWQKPMLAGQLQITMPPHTGNQLVIIQQHRMVTHTKSINHVLSIIIFVSCLGLCACGKAPITKYNHIDASMFFELRLISY